jgi:hypothetical protein
MGLRKASKRGLLSARGRVYVRSFIISVGARFRGDIPTLDPRVVLRLACNVRGMRTNGRITQVDSTGLFLLLFRDQ